MSDFLDRIGRLDPKRLALLAARLQARLDAVERERREPIAIIGMACRFPGGADTPEAFWRLLRDGTDAIREVTPDRWDVDALFDPDPDAPGKMSTRWAGLLDRVDLFDAPFFGISPREAATMDPQQRLLLELSWEALERAAVAPDGLAGSATGVFVGISGSDYSQLNLRAGLDALDAYSASGSAHSVAAGRLSFVLGLQGPCFPIDTACSSSLVAVHQAVQSLRAGECGLALAGGVNLILSPETSVALSKSRMMAPDGRCKAFDARADGFVRGEGGAVLVLKRLSDAQADGDPVLAVIRGSAINQDGRSNGLTAPNGPSQEAVIRAALASGGIEPAEVGFVEAHGTGTSLGDPIEVQALAAVFGGKRERPLPIGSVKANIGHLESAAGIAGLVKLVLCIRQGEIPPQIHLTQPNPHIPWSELPVSVPTQPLQWSDGPRAGGVSSFGFSGTNAHVIVGEAPDRVERRALSVGQDGDRAGARPLHLLALSAKGDTALRELAARYASHLATAKIEVTDVCHTANVGRAHFTHRAALRVRSLEDAESALAALANGDESTNTRFAQASPTARPRLGFLFTGQGAQYVGMGRGLFETQPTFRAALERCDALLRDSLERPLLSVFYPAPGEEGEAERLLARTRYTQPALFALEYALTELWRSWGVMPAAVLGHSVGEYAAACAAGVFGLEEGLALIAERARLMDAQPAGGAMFAVFAPGAAVEAAAAHGRVSVAAFNGPEHVVVSGAEANVGAVVEALAADGFRSQRLAVSHAFHSPLMEPVLAPFAAAAGRLAHAPPRVTLVSNVTGEAFDADAPPGAEYWVRHVRQPVQFARGIQALRAAGCTHFLEIGPAPVLLALGRRCLEEDDASGSIRNSPPESRNLLWLPSLRPRADDWETMLDSLAGLYTAGLEIDWKGFDRDYGRRRVVLPTYPFQRERHWSAPALPWTSTRPQPEDEPNAASDRLDELLFEVAWLPADPENSGDAAAGAAFPAPGELVSVLEPRFARLCAENGMARYDAMLPALDAAAAVSIVAALRDLGWCTSGDERFTRDGLLERLGVLPRHRRLLGRLLAILAEEGFITVAGDGWRVAAPIEAVEPQPLWDALLREHRHFETEISLVARCAGGLARVLRGEADPLQLIFPHGSLADAERLYQETPVARTYNALVGEAVAAAIDRLPADRPLRVLEVGAGTGGTTAAVLGALPAERTEYLFTDVSPLFLGKARAKFAAYPFVRYATLDVSRPPAEQGLDGARFDVVIAANVVHATPDLRRTLDHLAALAPGGLLVLYEAMNRQRFSDLTVGLTDGWWAFTDTELRPDYALLSHARWRELLAERGFRAAIVPNEAAEGVLAQQAVIVARAAEPVEVPVVAPHPGAVAATSPQGRARNGASAPAIASERSVGEGHSCPWLLLADAGGFAARLGEALREHGERVVLASAGTTYGRTADDVVEVDATRQSDFARLLEESPTGWRGVVYHWGLDAALDEDISLEELASVQQRAVGGALYLVQALARRDGEAPRLSIVTRDAQPVATGAGSAVAQSSLWGLSHTVALEHPELRCRRIDLEADSGTEAADRLAAELLADSNEDQIGLLSAGRRVRRLVRAKPAVAGERLHLRPDASYLVTGGLRGLGPRVAEWLVERGARHLVLIGRSEPVADARAAIGRLEAAGARVLVARGDVADRGRVAEILDEAARTMPPLRGVIHSAGVLDDGVLLQQSWPRFETVFAPKVLGGWNLHTLTCELPLDFFVLFSSGVGLLGAAGQGNHAAANAFIDALAHYRHARGLPALSINWGAWAEIGAAAEHHIEKRGAESFSPEDGLRALETGLLRSMSAAAGDRPLVQLAVLAADWTQALRGYAPDGEPPLLRELAREVRSRAGEPVARPPEPDLLAQVAAAPPNRRAGVIQRHVRRLAAEVLAVGDASRIDLHQPLQELGLDSLMAVELRNKLGRAVERTFPATLLFEYPTVAALAAHLTDAVLPDPPAADRHSPAEPTSVELSEEALGELLLRKLERLEAGS